MGWLWEVVVQDGFDLIKSSDNDLEESVVVMLEIVYALIVVIIVLCVHLYVRDWDTDALAEEDQRTLNAYSAHAAGVSSSNSTGAGAAPSTPIGDEASSSSMPRPSESSVTSVSHNGSTITV